MKISFICLIFSVEISVYLASTYYVKHNFRKENMVTLYYILLE